jgi:hypothetical protein
MESCRSHAAQVASTAEELARWATLIAGVPVEAEVRGMVSGAPYGRHLVEVTGEAVATLAGALLVAVPDVESAVTSSDPAALAAVDWLRDRVDAFTAEAIRLAFVAADLGDEARWEVSDVQAA